MPKTTLHFRPLLLALLASQTLCIAAQTPDHNPFPGFSAAATKTGFPGYTATVSETRLPGLAPSPLALAPLAARPTVLALAHLEPSEMSDADTQVVSNLHAALAKEVSRSNFEVSDPAWHYQQIICAAFPGYIFLAFTHGPSVEGSSRFVAILPRDLTQVRIVSTYAHGLLPFHASWERAGSFAVFNSMLRRERGSSPLSEAPNWLLVGICYAELSGYPVQVLSTLPDPRPTLDLLRLEANRPQLVVGADKSANLTFSDVSQPTQTTNWSLHFDRKGEITAASRKQTRQAPSMALAP